VIANIKAIGALRKWTKTAATSARRSSPARTRDTGQSTTRDMMLRNTATGMFELYTVTNDGVAAASPIGAVGLDWQIIGFGPCNGPGSTDMILRNQNSGAFEVYNIAGSQLTGAAPLGALGLDWQDGGIQVHLTN
jgi:hypothetical protein